MLELLPNVIKIYTLWPDYEEEVSISSTATLASSATLLDPMGRCAGTSSTIAPLAAIGEKNQMRLIRI